MSRARFFLGADWEGGFVPLEDEEMRHLVSVLRAEPGEEIVLVVPDGRQIVARIDEVREGGVSARPCGEMPAAWMPQVILVQGVAKNPRMDVAVEKATELGVAEIIPFLAARSVIRFENGRAAQRRTRWQRIATAAARQSRRPSVPVVCEPATLDMVLGRLESVDHVLVFDEDGSAPGVGDALGIVGARSSDHVAAVVGPEGGLSPYEVDKLVAMGGRRVSLGPTVLRTETAGAVAVALIAYELGGLGGVRRE